VIARVHASSSSVLVLQAAESAAPVAAAAAPADAAAPAAAPAAEAVSLLAAVEMQVQVRSRFQQRSRGELHAASPRGVRLVDVDSHLFLFSVFFLVVPCFLGGEQRVDPHEV
jgi:hypothetical protein